MAVQNKIIITKKIIKLLEGHHGWNIRYPVTRRGEYWLERADSIPVIQDIIVVLEFLDFPKARKWLMTESKFKISSFPPPYASDIFIAPINFIPSFDNFGNTFLMSEYPKSMMDLMKEKYAPNMRMVMSKFDKHNDQLAMQCVGVEVKRGSWIKPNSIVLALRFRNENDAMDFWRDPEYRALRDEMNRLAERTYTQYAPDSMFLPTTIMFTTNEIRV